MNRIEFMTELAALLQDIPAVERQDAMKYYNDYFDDAGEENEQKVIEELGSPAQVAETIKADLGVKNTASEKTGEVTHQEYQEQPKTSPVLKVILLIAILVVAAPVIIPVGLGILAVVFGGLCVIAALFFALVIACVAVAFTGAVLFVAGLVSLVPELAVGFALIGVGLILGVVGVIGTVGSVRLCIIVLPGIFRGVVWLCRRPFANRRAVA